MKLVLIALTIAMSCLLAACERRTQAEIDSSYYQSGYTRGHTEGHSEGYQKGYADGFATVHPSGPRLSSGPSRFVITALSYAGGAKVLIALLAVCISLIEKSRSVTEQFAKLLMGAIGAVLAYFTGSSVGLVSSLENILLLPAPRSLWIITMLFAALGYISAIMFGKLYRALDGVKIEAWAVLICAALGAIVGESLVRVFLTAPSSSGYLITPILIGVLVGGAFYFAMRLLALASKPLPGKS